MTIISSTRPPVDESGLDHGELLPLDELRALQLSRLQRTVRNAYQNVPHYHRALDAVGVTPDDIHTLADVARLPFTTKRELRDNYPFGMFAVPMSRIARIHASSGTTGRPTVVGYTRGDLDTWAKLVGRSLRGAGVLPGMKVHNAYGYGLFTGGLGAHSGIEAVGATVIPMSGGQTEKQVQLIQDFEPEFIMCTPSYLMTIGDCMERFGVNPATTSLRGAVLGAEPWTNAMREEIENRFNIDAVDIYGLSEVMGPGVACEQVSTKDGPTIWEDHFYPEIINPETGEPLPDGEEGELVFTSLSKEAFPVLRYRTRDITTLLPGTAHPSMRRMRKVTGRNDDMIILRGVNLFPTQIEEIALKIDHLSPHFMLELTRPGRMDELTVKIEAREGLTQVEVDQACRKLAAEMKTHIGSSIRVIAVPSGTVPRSEGKQKMLYDLRESH